MKCKHGLDFCCSCRYGEKSYLDHRERYRDLLHEINMPMGYKLVAGFNLNKQEAKPIE